jgi:hypothetical protein
MRGGGGGDSGGASWADKVIVVVGALAIAAAWVFVSHPLEGPVVLTLSKNHGVHITDVLAIIPIAWAWRFVRRS